MDKIDQVARLEAEDGVDYTPSEVLEMMWGGIFLGDGQRGRGLAFFHAKQCCILPIALHLTGFCLHQLSAAAAHRWPSSGTTDEGGRVFRGGVEVGFDVAAGSRGDEPSKSGPSGSREWPHWHPGEVGIGGPGGGAGGSLSNDGGRGDALGEGSSLWSTFSWTRSTIAR